MKRAFAAALAVLLLSSGGAFAQGKSKGDTMKSEKGMEKSMEKGEKGMMKKDEAMEKGEGKMMKKKDEMKGDMKK